MPFADESETEEVRLREEVAIAIEDRRRVPIACGCANEFCGGADGLVIPGRKPELSVAITARHVAW